MEHIAWKRALIAVLDLLLPRSEEERLAEDATLAELLAAQTASTSAEWFAPLPYRDKKVKALIWTLKYRERRASAELLSHALAEFLTEELADKKLFGFEKPLLIPMPLAKKRRQERGFNQCEMLCESLLKLMPELEYEPALLRKGKETAPQTKLKSRKEREQNLDGAFAVGDVYGRNVIVLDDVITTGSTMREVKKVLLEARAKDVWCVACAH